MQARRAPTSSKIHPARMAVDFWASVGAEACEWQATGRRLAGMPPDRSWSLPEFGPAGDGSFSVGGGSFTGAGYPPSAVGREAKHPGGEASSSTCVSETFEGNTRKWVLQIHASEGRSADSALATLPPEEVGTWVVDWRVTMTARGWRLDGAPVINHCAALRGYLRKAANGRSKPFREVSQSNGALFRYLGDEADYRRGLGSSSHIT